MSRIRDKKRAIILSAACETFANNGYAGTKIIDIANKIETPKANIYYYFDNKKTLYRSVLESFITPLLNATAPFDRYHHPAAALTDFIKLKIEISKNHPNASKVFANEILHGAPHLPQDIIEKLCQQTTGACNKLQQWIDKGLMDDVAPMHLLFMLWAATQTYADFNWQIKLHLKTDAICEQQFALASDTLIKVILKGCGITPPMAQ
ncbi:MAG: TetR family transcriptional regulator C-terminal domain-containing protein [Oceanospirillaceae bacterium]|nr:TetR family transcriptional regulator C-terminal domain-containing protein [Oceanospirillaceae bacterium]